ncbi:MAG TPA: phosphoribosyl-ATP diphosphatase [Acidimicrobiales bacterium]
MTQPEGDSGRWGVIARLEDVLRDRQATRPPGSYSARLLGDTELVQRKLMEEAFETCLELGRDPVDPGRAAEEAADLVFHLMVGLVGAGLSFADVVDVLDRRRS